MNTQLPSALDPGDDVQQIEPDKAMPRALILDIEEPLEKFQKVLSQFVSLAIDMQAAVGDVLDCIKDRKDAEYEISYTGYEMSGNANICVEEPDEEQEPSTQLVEIPDEAMHGNESAQYVQARDEFARELLQLFDFMQLYRNGKLFYELQQMLGNALVLGKIGVPVLTNDQRLVRHVNNITREASGAAERRRAANAALRESTPQPFVSLLQQYGAGPVEGLRHLPGRAHRLG